MEWLGHVPRMKSTEITDAVLEFEKGDARKTWQKIVRDELKSLMKPSKMTTKKWETEWFDLCKESAQHTSQWRAKGQLCLNSPIWIWMWSEFQTLKKQA